MIAYLFSKHFEVGDFSRTSFHVICLIVKLDEAS
jgi:hypothetical protein